MTGVRRVALVAVLTAVTLFVTAPPGSTGEQPFLVLESDATCNEATGEYDIVYSFVNPFDNPAIVDVSTYRVDDLDVTPPVFSPDPVPTLTLATAVDSVPGTSTSTFMSIVVDDAVDDDFAEVTTSLDGSCTAVEPEPEPAPAAGEVVTARPAFTG